MERKIKEVRKSAQINVKNERLALIQWETLMHQFSNSINNLPIGLKNRTLELENLDLIRPKRLILGRNNERSPNAPLLICSDHKKIFKAWFKAWIISFVPLLIDRPKWHNSKGEANIGDIVLFLKNENEYENHCQYGKIP